MTVTKIAKPFDPKIESPWPVKLKGKLGAANGDRQILHGWLSRNNISTYQTFGVRGLCYISKSWDWVYFKNQEDQFLFVMSCQHLINK